jgi:hypothetical protein
MLFTSVSPLLYLIPAMFYIVSLVLTVMNREKQPECETHTRTVEIQPCETPYTILLPAKHNAVSPADTRRRKQPVFIACPVFYPPDISRAVKPFYKIVFSRPPPPLTNKK